MGSFSPETGMSVMWVEEKSGKSLIRRWNPGYTEEVRQKKYSPHPAFVKEREVVTARFYFEKYGFPVGRHGIARQSEACACLN
jgi:hypothetical protein